MLNYTAQNLWLTIDLPNTISLVISFRKFWKSPGAGVGATVGEIAHIL